MRRKLAIGAAGLLVVLGIGCAGAFWYWTRTPQYSLQQAGRAYVQRDLATFKRYVDIDGITAALVDTLVAEAAAQQPSSEGVFAGAAQGMIMMMKPRMVDEYKAAMAKRVETYPEEDRALKVSSMKVAIDGKQATVNLELWAPGTDRLVKFDLRMREMGGYWQVAEWMNGADWVRAHMPASE